MMDDKQCEVPGCPSTAIKITLGDHTICRDCLAQAMPKIAELLSGKTHGEIVAAKRERARAQAWRNGEGWATWDH